MKEKERCIFCGAKFYRELSRHGRCHFCGEVVVKEVKKNQEKAFEALPTVKRKRTLGDAIVDAQIFKVNVSW